MTLGRRQRVLFATKNPGKLLEFKKAFEKLSSTYEIISFNDLSYTVPDCEETGMTFADNALLKARNAKSYLQVNERDVIIIADDSGMEINCLNGEPGVHTRRWAGYAMSDNEIIDYCLNKLVNEADRSAAYVSCFAISLPNNIEKTIIDRSTGVILQEPRSNSELTGMPFRSLFFVPELNMMFHQVRDLLPKDRKGYQLGQEQAIIQTISYLGSSLL